MAHLGKRIGIAMAQVNANAMGLESTGDRLKVLRRQLRRHKEMSDPQRKDNIKWAMAKIRDTRETLEIEADRHLGTEEWERGLSISRTLNKATKFMGVVATTMLMVGHIRDILIESCSRLHVGLVLTATATLVAGAFHIADRLFSRDLEESVGNIAGTMDRCYRSLSRDFEDFEKAFRAKEE